MTAALGLIHGRSAPHSPWQNGIIERSHRTDNEELFDRERFADAEERRYRLRLWEYEYNTRRPHQALGGRTPQEEDLDALLLSIASLRPARTLDSPAGPAS